MIRQRLFASISGFFAALLVVTAIAMPVSAASNTSIGGTGNGLQVSPVTTEITVDKGETKTIAVYADDVTSAPINLEVAINDFTSSGDESGTPALLLDPGQYAPTHSLKRFVAPISNISLKPGQQKKVNVTITIPKTAAAGGYYGAVRFVPVSTNTKSSVTLSASVGSLILVRVPGDIKEDMKLLSIDTRHGASGSAQSIFTSNKGLVIAARFENMGDVQEQPFGKVLLKKGNTVIATYEINDTTPRGNVLPDSIRKFTVNLDKVGSFGKYTLIGNFGYGSNGQLLSAQTTFYVIPAMAIIGVVVLLLIILFFIFVFPRMVRQYNRRVIRKAGRR